MRIVAVMLAGLLSIGGCAQMEQAGAPAPHEAPRESSRETPREASRETPREAAREVVPRPAVAQADAERLLAHFVRVRRMSAAELAREREAARRALSAEASDEQRVRYAITLSVAVDGNVDAGRAIEVIEPVTKRESTLQSLAIALRSLLAELLDTQLERDELGRKLDSLKALERSLSGPRRTGK